MADLLNMAHINSLPQPLFMHEWGSEAGKWWWPVHDIDVETGLLRIDVCGKLQAKHISDAKEFRDADGTVHDSETFYSDYERPAPAHTSEQT